MLSPLEKRETAFPQRTWRCLGGSTWMAGRSRTSSSNRSTMASVCGMEHRTLGRTGRSVSVVGLGTWQLGADWGDVSESDARAVLEASAEAGVTFYDTADVYGDGRSEQTIGAF